MNAFKSTYRRTCQNIAAWTEASSKTLSVFVLFGFGCALLVHGLHEVSFATLGEEPGSGVPAGDDRIYAMAERLFELVEGNLGSLIMIMAGLMAIIAAAFAQFRIAIGLLVVAVGAFILKSLVVIFFNYQN